MLRPDVATHAPPKKISASIVYSSARTLNRRFVDNAVVTSAQIAIAAMTITSARCRAITGRSRPFHTAAIAKIATMMIATPRKRSSFGKRNASYDAGLQISGIRNTAAAITRRNTRANGSDNVTEAHRAQVRHSTLTESRSDGYSVHRPFLPILCSAGGVRRVMGDILVRFSPQ